MVSIALLSDIHGNLPAFDAVAADIAQRRPDAVYVLGDMINGCPWSAEVLDRLLDLGWPMLLGNHDDAVLQLDTPRMEPRYRDRPRYAALWWTREHLADRHLAALAALPLEETLTLARRTGAAPAPRPAGQFLRRLPPRLPRRLGRAPPGRRWRRARWRAVTRTWRWCAGSPNRTAAPGW